MLKVPLADLQAQYKDIEQEILRAVKVIYDHKTFIE